MSKKNKTSKTFISWIKKYLNKSIFLIFFLIFIAFYPGQNYYQTLKISFLPPKINPISDNFSFSPSFYPSVKGISSPPFISANAAILMDVPSAVILFQKNPYMVVSPASTTKIMTALVSLEHYKLDDVLLVRKLETVGATMGLSIGDRVTFESVLYGLLVNSGNDAALVLADNYPGGFDAFINKMNEKASELALVRTHFVNPNGFTDQEHYTTALDLARLASMAMKNPVFAKIVSTKNIIVTDIFKKKYYRLDNVNKLLGVVPGLTGVKTGWTTEAGECLVASTERDDKKIISVVLGSKDRFSETKELIEWGFGNFTWEEVPNNHL